jgi:hypothetical protein
LLFSASISRSRRAGRPAQLVVRIALQRVQHSARIAMEFVKAAALDAAVAVIRRIVEVADDVDDATLLDRHPDAAARVAETARS